MRGAIEVQGNVAQGWFIGSTLRDSSLFVYGMAADFWVRILGMNTKYLRDGRAPIPLKEVTSKVMSANKAKNTTPEIKFRKLLAEEGIKGYRSNWKKVAGTPDIAFTKQKVAIFINGCFWHRCPYCKSRLPNSHRNFWENKFAKNKIRDKEKVATLRKDGWKVLTIWECQIKKHPDRSILRVRKALCLNRGADD